MASSGFDLKSLKNLFSLSDVAVLVKDRYQAAQVVRYLQERGLPAVTKSHLPLGETFAFQAGRELRVLVEPDKVDDATATMMAGQISEEIEKKLTYPGQVKVTVIRELRSSSIAK